MAARSRESAPANYEAPPTATEEEFSLASPKLGSILSLLALFIISFFYFLFVHYPIETDLRLSISICVAISLCGFVATVLFIPVAAQSLSTRNLFGHDINKKKTPQAKVPEALGIVTGIVFLVVAILVQVAISFLQYYHLTADSHVETVPTSILLCSLILLPVAGPTRAFAKRYCTGQWLVQYNAALACICFMTLLGFVDDVLDVPWSVKLALPFFAALPLVMAYAGHTSIIIPKPLLPYVGLSVLDLGLIYKVYMIMLVIFCTNSINIHAGINGLEVGQTIVISFAILIFNLMQIGASTEPDYKQAHVFSIYIVLPLLTTSLGLLAFNWYPSSVFVGDTYTYFAGMTMAVVGILGHFSETLLLFFLPQVLNFLYSCPQLFGIVPCPRHRLPRFDPQTGLLTGTSDMNLVNLFLRLFGQCTEKSLCIRLLVFQAFSCLVCFGLRSILAGWYK